MNASTLKFRLFLLFFISAVTLGSYYSYDLPGGLPSEAQLYIGHNTTAGYGLLYSVYSYPNVILPFLGGWLIDHVFGLRVGTITTASLIVIGNALVAVGATLSSEAGGELVPFVIAVAGRFVFGSGGETLTVAQSNLLVRWYPLEERALAFALVLAFSRLGGALNIMLEKPIYEKLDTAGKDKEAFATVCWSSAAVCLFSLFCGVAIVLCDLAGERQGAVSPEHGQRPKASGAKEDLNAPLLEEGAPISKEPTAPLIEPQENLDGALPAPLDGAATRRDEDDDDMSWRERIFDIRHVLRARENLIYLAGLAFYLGVLSFVSYGKKYFDHKFPGCAAKSSTYLSLPYYIAAGASPLFGFLIDRYGRALLCVSVSSISLLGVHIYLHFSPSSNTCGAIPVPLISMVWLGFTYSLCAASIWPMLALIVQPKRLGTGYGVMTAVQNAGFAFFPSILGNLLDSSSPHKFVTMEWIFIGLSAAATAFSCLLVVVDAAKGSVLIASAKFLAKRDAGKDGARDEPVSRTHSFERGGSRAHSFER